VEPPEKLMTSTLSYGHMQAVVSSADLVSDWSPMCTDAKK